MTAKLDAALAYAAAGIKVFPCHSIAAGRCTCGGACGTNAGKHPRWHADDLTTGHLSATTDTEQVRRWWERWPDANIGAAMKASGLIAIDIDPRNGGDESWAAIERADGTDISRTWTNLTGGGGAHLIYDAPPDLDYDGDSIEPGVDVKWKGYIILPPSDHREGRPYAWEGGFAPEDGPASLLPPALYARLGTNGVNGTNGFGERTPIAELLATPCREGSRDNTLARIAGWARNHVGQAEAEVICQTWNTTQCRPPLPLEAITEKVARFYRRYQAPPTAVISGAKTPDVREDGRRFEIIGAPAYMDRPPTKWVMRGILPETSFACIYGPPGSYKSFAVLDMLACIALGVPYHGHQTVQGSCLYIAGEGGGGLSKRLRAWQAHHGHTLTDALKILPAAVPLVDATAVHDLVRDIKSFDEPFIAIVVDTLARALAGEDENTSTAMGAAIDAAGLLQQELGCVVIVVHHGTKADGTLRGHSSLPGALETIIRVQADKEGVVRMVFEKQKDGEELQPIYFRRVVVNVGRPGEVSINNVGADEHPTSVALVRLSTSEERTRVGVTKLNRLTERQRATLTALVSFGATGATLAEWREAAAAVTPGLKRQTFDAQVKALVEEHALVSVVTARQGEGVFAADGRVVEALKEVE